MRKRNGEFPFISGEGVLTGRLGSTPLRSTALRVARSSSPISQDVSSCVATVATTFVSGCTVQLLCRHVKRFRGGLVFKAPILVFTQL